MSDSKASQVEKWTHLIVSWILLILGILAAIRVIAKAEWFLVIGLVLLTCYEIFHWYCTYQRTFFSLIKAALNFAAAIICGAALLEVVALDVMLMAFPVWAMIIGLVHLAHFVYLYKTGEGGGGWMLLCGFLSLVSGLLMLFLPIMGIMTMSEFSDMLAGFVFLLHSVYIIVEAYR